MATGYRTPSAAAWARTLDTTCSKANSGVCTPTTTKPSLAYSEYQASTCGSDRWQLMHEYVQKSTRTTLPRSPLSDSVLPPGVFSQAVIPVKFGAGPQFTSVVAVESHLLSDVCAVPVRLLSWLRMAGEPCSAVV